MHTKSRLAVRLSLSIIRFLAVQHQIYCSCHPDFKKGKNPLVHLSGTPGSFKETSLAFIDSGLGSIIEQLRVGLSPSAIDVISKELDMSVDSLLRELKLPRSTVKSR